MSTAIKIKSLNDLKRAEDGSYYTILGAGGELSQWVNGYTEMLEKEGIGTPVAWYATTGKQINEYIGIENDKFQDVLCVLLFPLDGLDVGKLALFKLRMEDRWFDDICSNNRGR